VINACADGNHNQSSRPLTQIISDQRIGLQVTNVTGQPREAILALERTALIIATTCSVALRSSS
jgi:hypothetical protein